MHKRYYSVPTEKIYSHSTTDGTTETETYNVSYLLNKKMLHELDKSFLSILLSGRFFKSLFTSGIGFFLLVCFGIGFWIVIAELVLTKSPGNWDYREIYYYVGTGALVWSIKNCFGDIVNYFVDRKAYEENIYINAQGLDPAYNSVRNFEIVEYKDWEKWLKDKQS